MASKVIRPVHIPSACRSPLTSLIATRHSSLSAIHRGLRQSDRIQGTTSKRTVETRRPRDARARQSFHVRESSPGPFDQFDAALRDGRRESRSTSARTTRALAGAATPRQRAKLRKKLSRQAEEEDREDGKQTRRKRFVDPDASHGKRSLVYQLKYGALKEKATQVKLDEPVRPSLFRSRTREREVEAFQNGETETGSRHELGRPHYDGQNRSRPYGQESRRRDFPERSRRDNKEAWDPNAAAVDKARKGGLMPMTVKFTTAASQFLYGRSVVKSALTQARRRLYNLYIYGNEARIDKKDDDAIRHLAHFHKVPITVVPEGEQRLMDKMSSGRPHNGYVLESSPLPQPPVTSLGPLVETPGKLGFNVTLGHQTKEELAVNGEETFMPRAINTTPKPFVLLLNEILDPGNLGGLIRTASYLGVDAVGITSRSSSTLTPVVLKSAAGAVEEVTIFTVDDPAAFIEASKKAGWKTYASVAPPAKKLASMHAGKFLSSEDVERNDPLANDPCILVLGNEGHGLSKQVKVAADYEVSVPRFVHGHSSVDSLNVSVAAGLLCHAFVKTSAAKFSRNKVPGAMELQENDDVSKTIREQARELF